MKAKHLSFLSKAISVGYVLTASLVIPITAKRPLTGDEAWAIIQIGYFIFSLFLPVDISMIIRNIRGEVKP